MAEQQRALAEEIARLIEWVGALESRLDRQRLAAAQVRPGQLPDGLLVEDTTRFTKGKGVKHFGRTTRLERAADGLVVEATVKFAGIAASQLRKAFAGVTDAVVDQMHNVGLPAAGRILSANVRGDTVVVRAKITDKIVALKASEAVYSGISVDLDGDEVAGIALVDAPSAGWAKVAGSECMIAKLFSSGKEKEIAMTKVMSKSDEEATKAVEELLNRAIVPDASDAAKRSQAYSDWQMLYRAGRRQIVDDPRFTIGR